LSTTSSTAPCACGLSSVTNGWLIVPAGFGRAAKPSENYTEARSDNNRVNPVLTPCDEPPQRRNILLGERSRLSLANA
jgi:hypothetical protein